MDNSKVSSPPPSIAGGDYEVDYEALPTSSIYVNLFAGALAGITEHTVMYPIDSIKTRMQVLHPNPSAIYSGVLNAISKISSTEGVTALWRGMNSVVVGAGIKLILTYTGPSHALYFATYEYCKANYPQNYLGIAAAGASATIMADGFMNPFDVIKQRMQVHGSTFPSAYQCGKSVLRAEGISAFYASYPTTLMMTIPFQTIYFPTYEYLGKTLNPSGKYDPKTHIISGGLAGGIAALSTTPLDVVKTVLQTRGTDSTISEISGMSQAMRAIYRESGGFKGFFKGAIPRVIAHMPSTAICFLTYESIKHFIVSSKNSN